MTTLERQIRMHVLRLAMYYAELDGDEETMDVVERAAAQLEETT